MSISMDKYIKLMKRNDPHVLKITKDDLPQKSGTVDLVIGTLEELKKIVKIASDRNDALLLISSFGETREEYRALTVSKNGEKTSLPSMDLDKGASFIRTVMNIALDWKFIEDKNYFEKKDAKIEFPDLKKVVTLFYRFKQHPLHACADNSLTILVSPLRKNKTSLRTLNAKQKKTKAKEDELDLFVKCHNPFWQPPELDTKQVETLGKIIVETIKHVAKSTRTKAFILRRFKNKKDKSFKHSILGESKYKMIAEHAKWAEKERDKLKKYGIESKIIGDNNVK